MAGFALPCVAFITCPTRKPSAAFLPALKSSTDLGVGREHLVHRGAERALVGHLGEPLAAHDRLRRPRPSDTSSRTRPWRSCR